MNRTALIAIVTVAVLILVGGGIAVIGGIGKSVTEDKGTLEAETYIVDKIPTSLGWKTASSGNSYVLAKITITNEKESGGISNNLYYMTVKAEGVTYTHDSATYTAVCDDAYDLKDIGKGASSTSCYFFQIPTGVVSTAEVVYDGTCKLSSKTTYKGETTMKENLTYGIIASQTYMYDLTDGSTWTPIGDYKFMELKVKLTCNFEDVKNINQYDWRVSVGGKTYYMQDKSSQIVTEPYIDDVNIAKGQTVTLTQVYQIPVGADLSTVNVAWTDSWTAADGTVTIVNA